MLWIAPVLTIICLAAVLSVGRVAASVVLQPARSPTCSASRRSRFGHGSMQLDNIGRTDAAEVDYDPFRDPARSWQVAVSATTSFRSSPEIVPCVVDGQHWMLEAVSGSTL
jgi:hypothetical protein